MPIDTRDRHGVLGSDRERAEPEESSGSRAAPSDLALAISAIPGLARDLRDAHVATPDGRCGVCSAGPQAGHVRHPCRLHDLAVAALAQIAERRARG